MIKLILMTLTATVLAVATTGCVSAWTPSGNRTDVHDVDFSGSFKTGSDCSTFVLLFGPFGDASIVNAAKAAGIRKVEIIDYQRKWYPFVSKYCVLVYGN